MKHTRPLILALTISVMLPIWSACVPLQRQPTPDEQRRMAHDAVRDVSGGKK